MPGRDIISKRARRPSLLRYQLRFEQGREPESLIAVDVADALRQARARAYALQTPVALWREGALIVECAVPPHADIPAIDPGVLERLVAAGFYVYGHRPLSESDKTGFV